MNQNTKRTAICRVYSLLDRANRSGQDSGPAAANRIGEPGQDYV
jgi:hypothetical protein